MQTSPASASASTGDLRLDRFFQGRARQNLEKGTPPPKIPLNMDKDEKFLSLAFKSRTQYIFLNAQDIPRAEATGRARSTLSSQIPESSGGS